MQKTKTCCFIGHRRLPKEKIENTVKRLNQEVDNLISQGVTDFISGGALGFDQIAASFDTNLQWNIYSKAVESDCFYYLIQSAQQYTLLPKRCFDNENQQIFRSLVEKNIGPITMG